MIEFVADDLRILIITNAKPRVIARMIVDDDLEDDGVAIGLEGERYVGALLVPLHN